VGSPHEEFVGDATRSMVFEVHGAQVEAILLFDKWLDEHYHGPDPEVLARVRDIIEQNLAFDAELGGLLGMSELFLTGGRRSGKTFLMEAILCSYAVAVRDSIVWTVVPSEKFIEEPLHPHGLVFARSDHAGDDEPTAAGRAFADLDIHVITAPSLRLDVEALDATSWS